MNGHVRLYRMLLVVYPKQHRSEYGESMAQLARDRLRDEGGGVRTARIWAALLSDLATSAARERMESSMQAFKSGWWRFALAHALHLPNTSDTWSHPFPTPLAPTLADRLRTEARWTVRHLLPWICQSLTDRSSADGRHAKRPHLTSPLPLQSGSNNQTNLPARSQAPESLPPS